MKILFVSPYVPSNIRARPYNFIKGLVKNGHSVSFIGLADPYTTEKTIRNLTEYCETVRIFDVSKSQAYLQCLIALFRKIPLQSAYTYSPNIKRLLQRMLVQKTFDVVHVEHIRSGYYLHSQRSVPVIYDSVDCITSLYRQFHKEKTSFFQKLVTALEANKLKNSEPHVLSKYDAALVSSYRDKKALQNLAQKAQYVIPKIQVIENCVDSEYFRSQNNDYEPYSIVFSGKMGYQANQIAAIHFARHIFPLIRSRIPNAKFYIVGAGPSIALNTLETDKHITVTGWVDDIRKYLSLAHVVVCPLRVSVGIQFKLLEAMSMGKAVVTYPEVAVPLQRENREIFLVAENPKKFAENIIKLMNDESLRLHIGRNARSYVKRYHNWDQKVDELQKLYITTADKFSYERKNKI